MGRFAADEAENYGGTGGAGYFGLKNDKDVATVRFMYDSIDDVEGYAVHEVEIDGRKRYVNCLRNYNDPMDKCPFCEAHMPQKAKLFVPIYNVDAGRTQIWDRGKPFFAKISSLCARYQNLVSHTFEIERNGKPGSTQTKYEIYETGADDTTLDDLPEIPDMLGTLVLDKSADEMRQYLNDGVFPSDDMPVRRKRSAETEEEPMRRTPATTRMREAF